MGFLFCIKIVFVLRRLGWYIRIWIYFIICYRLRLFLPCKSIPSGCSFSAGPSLSTFPSCSSIASPWLSNWGFRDFLLQGSNISCCSWVTGSSGWTYSPSRHSLRLSWLSPSSRFVLLKLWSHLQIWLFPSSYPRISLSPSLCRWVKLWSKLWVLLLSLKSASKSTLHFGSRDLKGLIRLEALHFLFTQMINF